MLHSAAIFDRRRVLKPARPRRRRRGMALAPVRTNLRVVKISDKETLSPNYCSTLDRGETGVRCARVSASDRRAHARAVSCHSHECTTRTSASSARCLVRSSSTSALSAGPTPGSDSVRRAYENPTFTGCSAARRCVTIRSVSPHSSSESPLRVASLATQKPRKRGKRAPR